MTTYTKTSDVLETVGVSGVLSAGLTWHVIGEGLAWAEFDKPADAIKYTANKRGKGRKFAVMTFEPGKQFSGVIYLTSVKRGLDAGQVVSESQLLDLYHGQEEKPAAEKEAKKPAVKATKKPVKKTSQASEKKPAKPAQKPAAKKSKSRIKLEAAQEAAKTIDVTAPEYLAFCAKISAGRQKPYSARNCEVLYAQTNGTATDVRGFKTWLSAGRAVKKGEKSLVIEAPRFVYDEKGQPVLDKYGRPKMYAVPCCVFDISQTEPIKEKKEA